MLTVFKVVFLIITFVLINACSKLDDYMLGKDNTPNPAGLKAIVAQKYFSEKWSVPIGYTQKNSTYLKLKPVILGNIVYTANGGSVVQAINAQTGHLIWSEKLNANVISGPTIAQGRVLLGTDSSTIVALNQADGKQLWHNNVSGDVLSKPLIVQDRVLAKTIDGNLYAFALTSGTKLWTTNHGAPSLILKASSSPVIINDKLVLVGFSDGKMDAIDIKTGQVIWQRSIAYANGASDIEQLVDIDADPIVQGDTVLLASYQGYVGALSLSSGQFIWRKPASTYKNIMVKDNVIFMTDSSDIIWSINKQNGHVNWQQDGLKARVVTEPMLVDNILLVGDKTGMLHLMSIKTGELIGRTQLSGPITIVPSVVNNTIYVITTNGKLSRFSVS